MNKERELELRVQALEEDLATVTGILDTVQAILKVHFDTHTHDFHGLSCPVSA